MIYIDRYRKTKFWAVWKDEELVAVCVYRKGAVSVKRWLEKLGLT